MLCCKTYACLSQLSSFWRVVITSFSLLPFQCLTYERYSNNCCRNDLKLWSMKLLTVMLVLSLIINYYGARRMRHYCHYYAKEVPEARTTWELPEVTPLDWVLCTVGKTGLQRGEYYYHNNSGLGKHHSVIFFFFPFVDKTSNCMVGSLDGECTNFYRNTLLVP